MGAKTTSSLPFSILPRLGFAPSHKTGSSSRSPFTENSEEDWYIPYNGPLEPPKNVSMAKQDTLRRSVSQDDVNAFLEDSQLLDRYRDTSVNDAEPVKPGPPAQSAGFSRTRVHSDFMRRTTSSSSVIDQIRPHPRQRQASAPRLQILTSMDASAGVGESPMPTQRIVMSSPQKKMGRFFGFGSYKKPKSQSISTPVSPINRTNILGTWLPSSVQHSTLEENVNFAKPSGSSPNTGNHFDSPYVTLPQPSRRSHTHHYPLLVDVADLSSCKQRSGHVDLHGKPDQDSFPSLPTTNYDSPTIFMAHPYATASPSVSAPALRPGTSQQSHRGHHQLDSGSYNTHFSHTNPTRRHRALTYALNPHSDRAPALVKNARPLTSPLKPSVSTPNLYAASHGKQPSQQSTKSTSPVAGVERWLSPETWCDALFFPRPRLKVKRAHGGSSGRIISPPITPVAEGATPRLSPALPGGRPQESLATSGAPRKHHTLLKSRSAIDVLSGPSLSGRLRTVPMSQRRPDPDIDPNEGVNLKEPESLPGASTAQQELRPPSPVPSLTQVLEEGEVLEEQRRRWQHQASHSFGNRRTRSLSRARTRSLSRSHGHKTEGSTTLEFLAARTLLGGQSIAPTVNVARTSHSRSHSHSHTSSNSRGRSSSYSFTHSHSHSLGKSNSQRSLTDIQPQSTRHVRNDSWGKTALLKACSPCADLSDMLGTPVENKKPALKPMTDESKVINPAGSSHNATDEGCVIVIGTSPAPTTPSGEGVGIALSSPPPSDDRLCLDPELPSMPSHPYATGAIYTRYLDPSPEHGLHHALKVSDYAGPHPSAYDPQLPSNTATSDVSMRHRLPPRAIQPGVISHPYAAAFASSEPVKSHVRQPSKPVIPTLPFPPSVVQEDKDFTSDNHISISSPDFERYGVGEALVFAAPPRDEQETDSEDQSLGTIIPCQQDTLSRIVDKGKTKDLTPVPMAPDSSRSRIPTSDSVVVSTRPPSLISVTAAERRDSTHSSGALRSTTNITSAHLVISALDNDDLDDFHDLFYKPPQSRLSSGKSSVKHQDASETSRGVPSDIHSSYSGSALTNLMRSMSEIGELHVAASDFSHGQRSGGPGDQRSDELSQTYVFMEMSRTPSPVQVDPCDVTQSPIQLYDAPFETGVPEDIESSRASSLMIASQENDTFGHPIRQSVVDAAGKSTIHQGSHRTSTYASIHDAAEEADLVSPISFIQSPLLSADAMRSSYMTSGSEYSRMSTLSDFPDPPAQPHVTPNQPSILQIYVDAPTPVQQSGSFQGTDCPQSESRVFSLESHRTTFGGSDDIDIITQVHRSEF